LKRQASITYEPRRKFEQLTAEIFKALTARNEFESVSKNVKLPGPDGDQEIDVLITGKVGPFAVKTIVEYKDYKKKLMFRSLMPFTQKWLMSVRTKRY